MLHAVPTPHSQSSRHKFLRFGDAGTGGRCCHLKIKTNHWKQNQIFCSIQLFCHALRQEGWFITLCTCTARLYKVDAGSVTPTMQSSVFPQVPKSSTRSKPCFLTAGLASVPSHVGLTVPYGTGNIICCRKGLCPLCSSSNNVLHAQELCSHKMKVGRERNSMYQITHYSSPKYFTNVSAESSHSSGGAALLTLPTW